MISFDRNLRLKILAVLITLVLTWLAHSDGNSSEIAITVPVEVTNLPSDRVVIRQSTNQAQVRVRGLSFAVSRLTSAGSVFKIKLPNDVGNTFKQTLQGAQLKLDPSLNVLSIEPPAVEFSLDTVERKSVPVVVPRIGSLPEALKLISLEVTPQNVEVTGPQTELGLISSVKSEPIDLRDIKTDINLDVGLSRPGKLSRVAPDRIRVALTLSAFEVKRSFDNRLIEVRATSVDKINLSQERATVEVKGPRVIVNTLSPEDVVPYIRLRGRVEPGQELELSVDLPKDVTLVRIEPRVVKVLAPPRPGKVLGKAKAVGH